MNKPDATVQIGQYPERGRCPAWGPFVAPNGASYWLVQSGFLSEQTTHEFVIVDGPREEFKDELWLTGHEATLFYSFAAMVIEMRDKLAQVTTPSQPSCPDSICADCPGRGIFSKL